MAFQTAAGYGNLPRVSLGAPGDSGGYSALGTLRVKYLTHWTLMFELFYLFFAWLSTLFAVTTFHGIPDGKGKATPWFVSVTWAMQGTALVMSVLVFLLYGLFHWKPLEEAQNRET